MAGDLYVDSNALVDGNGSFATPYRTIQAAVDAAAAGELFAKFMYLRNLEDALPAPEMRGWNLYVLKKRGVFRNTLSRMKKRDDGTWEVSEVSLSDADRAEVDSRVEYAIGDVLQKKNWR